MIRERLQDYQGNGKPVTPTFSAKEMQRRQDNIRKHMAEANVENHVVDGLQVRDTSFTLAWGTTSTKFVSALYAT